MTKTTILEFLQSNKQKLAQDYGVTKIGLFGSYARDEAKEDSDIDIAVEMESNKKNIHNFFFAQKRAGSCIWQKSRYGHRKCAKTDSQRVYSKGNYICLAY